MYEPDRNREPLLFNNETLLIGTEIILDSDPWRREIADTKLLDNIIATRLKLFVLYAFLDTRTLLTKVLRQNILTLPRSHGGMTSQCRKSRLTLGSCLWSRIQFSLFYFILHILFAS